MLNEMKVQTSLDDMAKRNANPTDVYAPKVLAISPDTAVLVRNHIKVTDDPFIEQVVLRGIRVLNQYESSKSRVNDNTPEGYILDGIFHFVHYALNMNVCIEYDKGDDGLIHDAAIYIMDFYPGIYSDLSIKTHLTRLTKDEYKRIKVMANGVVYTDDHHFRTDLAPEPDQDLSYTINIIHATFLRINPGVISWTQIPQKEPDAHFVVKYTDQKNNKEVYLKMKLIVTKGDFGGVVG